MNNSLELRPAIILVSLLRVIVSLIAGFNNLDQEAITEWLHFRRAKVRNKFMVKKRNLSKLHGIFSTGMDGQFRKHFTEMTTSNFSCKSYDK